MTLDNALLLAVGQGSNRDVERIPDSQKSREFLGLIPQRRFLRPNFRNMENSTGQTRSDSAVKADADIVEHRSFLE